MYPYIKRTIYFALCHAANLTFFSQTKNGWQNCQPPQLFFDNYSYTANTAFVIRHLSHCSLSDTFQLE